MCQNSCYSFVIKSIKKSIETAFATNPETSNFWFTLKKTVKEQLSHISETYFTKSCTVNYIFIDLYIYCTIYGTVKCKLYWSPKFYKHIIAFVGFTNYGRFIKS